MNIFNISDRNQIKDFEREYKSFTPKVQPYKKEYFLESKGAVRINPQAPFNLIIHNAELFEEINRQFKSLESLEGYRNWATNKRLEAEEVEENEIDVSKIPF